jgi:hypothetical protein
VKANKGSPGIDGMTVEELPGYLQQHGPAIPEQLLNGTYEPKPVRRVEIEKPDGGGMRKLGIPTVADRIVQQVRFPRKLANSQERGDEMAKQPVETPYYIFIALRIRRKRQRLRPNPPIASASV